MQRSLRLGVPILLSLVGLIAPPLTAGNAEVPVFSPGAPGIGDPYFPLDGNGGYDVGVYDLAVRYNPPTNVLNGVATIRAQATNNLSSFDLDFVGMTVRDITVNGRPAEWTRRTQELIITPAAGLPAGGRFTTVVRYDGVPKTGVDPLLGPVGFIHTDDGAVVAGQPHVAAAWFPVNDHPRDRASYLFHITVPNGTQAVANGVPRGHTTTGGWTTWNWQANDPMASYLATATTGQFDFTDYTAGGIRIIDALDPDLAGTRAGDNARGSLDREPEMLDFLQSYFGPYPFSTSGGVVDDNVKLSFALENQTRPIYSQAFFINPEAGDSVIIHELAHQWFGDSLTVDLWKDIWLNEGFATYAQWLWSEDQGLATVDHTFKQYYSIPADDPFWDVIVADPGPDELFGDAPYYRGALTLHALRQRIGDADFFELLHAWPQTQAGRNVSTDEFIALAEQVSGQNLDGFFNEWLYTPARPEL